MMEESIDNNGVIQVLKRKFCKFDDNDVENNKCKNEVEKQGQVFWDEVDTLLHESSLVELFAEPVDD